MCVKTWQKAQQKTQLKRREANFFLKHKKKKKLRMSEGLLNNTTEGILSNYCPWWPLMVSLKQLASPGTPSAGQQFSQIARCRPLPADALIKAAGGEGTALLVLPLRQMDNNWQSSLRTRQHLDLGLQIRGSLLQVTVEKKSANKNEKKKMKRWWELTDHPLLAWISTFNSLTRKLESGKQSFVGRSGRKAQQGCWGKYFKV